jgi:CBS domain-containing protein
MVLQEELRKAGISTGPLPFRSPELEKETAVVKTPTIREWMKQPIRIFRMDDPMSEAIHQLAKSSVAAVPVVDADGQVVGLLSEKQALRTIAGWTYDQVAGGTVGDHMSALSIRLNPDMDLLTALRAFLECDFSFLPVMENGRLVGRLTRNDLLKGMVAWASAIDAEQDERQSTTPEIERPSSIEEMQRVAASHTPDQLAEIFSER